MAFSALIVRLTAAVFAAYGVGFILAPAWMADLSTGAVPATASGLIDMRATYGGLSLAVGVLLWRLAASPETLRAGLRSVIVLMVGMAGGRLVGMALDGSANALMWTYLAAECVLTVIAAWLLARADTTTRHKETTRGR